MRVVKTIVKIILTIIAWLGVLVTLLGTFPGLYYVPSYFDGFEHYLTISRANPSSVNVIIFLMIIITGAGIFLALIGGFIARPRYLWQSLIVIGSFCIVAMLVGLAFLQYYNEKQNIFDVLLLPYLFEFFGSPPQILRYIIPFLPGTICIAEGITIWYLRKRSRMGGGKHNPFTSPHPLDSVSSTE